MKPLLIILLTLVLTGCMPVQKDADALVMAVIPLEDADTCQMIYKPFAEYMTDCLDRLFEIKTVSNYTATIEAMKYGHAHLGRLGAYSYVLGIDSGAEIDAIVYAIKAETNAQDYYSVIFVRADSDIYDIEQLEGRSLAYLDPASTSGHLMPRKYLEEHGIVPKDTVFSGSYDAAFNAVKNGTVDAAASTLARVGIAEELGVIGKGEMRVIWTSDPIPNPPIAAIKSLNPKLKEQITVCLCDIPSEIIEAWNFGWNGLARCSDEEFDGIRNAAGLAIPQRD
jgi:phosphonate transport system substrate-binding protein